MTQPVRQVQAIAQTVQPPPQGVLQRCACGGAAGPGGECAACKKKREAREGKSLQAKLRVSDASDPAEQEAEQTAARVMGGAPVAPGRAGMGIQRQATGQLSTAPRQVQSPWPTAGQPLDPGTRTFMESRFGHDFSGVRVHAGAEAASRTQAVQARAYTVGQEVAFGAGEYMPHTSRGRHLLAHELTHVVQQAGSGGTALQRQETSGQAPVHSSPVSRAMNVPSEKWRADVEASYRRAGFNTEANAVRFCREYGACNHLLTQEEAYRAYRKGRLDANLGEPPPEPARTPAAAAAPMAAGLTAPAWSGAGGAAAESAAARTALERAAVRWGTAEVLSGGAAATTAETATVGAAATSGAAVATVAVPVVVGVVLIVAIVDLFSYAKFELALRRAGYIVLPNPLGVCIGLCHTSPATPTPLRPFPDFPERPLLPDWPSKPLTPQERKRLEDWLEPQAPPTTANPPTTQTPPLPLPKTKPQEKPKRRNPKAYPLLWPLLHFGPEPQPMFARGTLEERDTSVAWQARTELMVRQQLDPDFRAKSYDVHHVVPLFLGGKDDLRAFTKGGNGVILPRSVHQTGHRLLRIQPQMLKPPPGLPPLPQDIYKHPVGTPYEVVGYKS